VKIKIARIFNTYGPRMSPDDGRVVSNFIVQALEGKDITIYGDGSQTRSFMYVDDLVDAMIRLMDTDESVVGPVNLGNPLEFSIVELANAVIRIIGSKSKITFHDLPEDDPIQRKPDITLAKKLLNNWEPKVNLEDGLVKTINYFKNSLSSNI
jgi:UDP-glucuronate decarboxylase